MVIGLRNTHRFSAVSFIPSWTKLLLDPIFTIRVWRALVVNLQNNLESISLLQNLSTVSFYRKAFDVTRTIVQHLCLAQIFTSCRVPNKQVAYFFYSSASARSVLYYIIRTLYFFHATGWQVVTVRWTICVGVHVWAYLSNSL